MCSVLRTGNDNTSALLSCIQLRKVLPRIVCNHTQGMSLLDSVESSSVVVRCSFYCLCELCACTTSHNSRYDLYRLSHSLNTGVADTSGTTYLTKAHYVIDFPFCSHFRSFPLFFTVRYFFIFPAALSCVVYNTS